MLDVTYNTSRNMGSLGAVLAEKSGGGSLKFTIKPASSLRAVDLTPSVFYLFWIPCGQSCALPH
jgi:hypothetical protein